MPRPTASATATATAPASATAPALLAPIRRTLLSIGLVALAATPALLVPLPTRAESRVQGSGHVVTVQRSLPLLASGLAPDAVAIAGDLRVELVQGTSPGITLVGDDNLLPLVETRLRGRSLHLGPRDDHDLAARQPIRVRLVLPALTTLAVGGSGQVEARGWRTPRLQVALGGSGGVALTDLDAARLDVNIGGSGHVQATGKGSQLDLTIGGSGSGRFDDYAVDSGRVTVAGSGSAAVRAERSLSVTIAGSGNVVQAGAAEPRSSIVGSGRVTRR